LNRVGGKRFAQAECGADAISIAAERVVRRCREGQCAVGPTDGQGYRNGQAKLMVDGSLRWTLLLSETLRQPGPSVAAAKQSGRRSAAPAP
jgi:hypothetical protein